MSFAKVIYLILGNLFGMFILLWTDCKVVIREKHKDRRQDQNVILVPLMCLWAR